MFLFRRVKILTAVHFIVASLLKAEYIRTSVVFPFICDKFLSDITWLFV